MAFSAVGAVLAGTATVTTTLAAVAEVGAVVSVVGAVTGSKDMMKVGGVMSLVGGVGSLVSGAIAGASASAGDVIAGGVQDAAANSAADYATMGYGATTDAAANSLSGIASSAGSTSGLDSISSGLSDIANTDSGSLTSDMMQQSGLQSNDFSTQGAINNVSSQMNQPITGNASAVDLSKNDLSMGPQASQAVQQGNASDSLNLTQTDQSLSPELNQNTMGTVKPQNDMIGAENRAGTISNKANAGSFMGDIKSLGEWMEKNKTLAGAIVQVGGSMLKNAFTPDYNQQYIDLKKRELDMKQSSMGTPAAPPVGAGGFMRPIINGAR